MQRHLFDMTVLLVVCLGATACQVEAPATPSGTPTTSVTPAEDDGPSAADSVDSQEDVADESASEGPDVPPEVAPASPVKPPPGPDDKAVTITFDDLKLEMEKDAVFVPSLLTERVEQLDGRRVRIRGFLFPSVFQQTGITSFPLIKNLQCKFGPGGQAHHIVIVEMKPGLSTSFTVRPIAVEGILTLRPWNGPDGNTWALYHMVGEKVD